MDRDSIEFLQAVTKHHDFLEAISKEPASKRTLADRLNVSKKTVYRKRKQLDDHGLIERTSEGFTLTVAGQVCIDCWMEFQSSISTVAKGPNLLNSVGEESVPPAPAFQGSTMIRNEPYSTVSPCQRTLDMLQSTEEATICLPVLEQQVIKLVRKRLTDGIEFQIICTPEVIEGLQNSNLSVFDQFVESEEITLIRTSAEIDYGLVVKETSIPLVQLLLFGTRGNIDGVIELDGRDSFEWARGIIRKNRDIGSEISLVND